MTGILVALMQLGAANPDATMNRTRTLMGTGTNEVLMEFDRQTRDTLSILSGILPRPCVSGLDSSDICPEKGGFTWVDSARQGILRLHPVLGLESRVLQDGEANAADVGVVVVGGIGPASFALDARIFSELQSKPLWSYDGEYVERQKEGNSSHFDYASYSRYRSRLTIETPIGRFGAGRETQNWGPSPFHALVLSSSSVPYNQLDWTVNLGPISVRSLVADLSIPGPGESRLNEDSRTMFAHRYEWRISSGLVLGASEALFLYNRNAPSCFLPIVPLFMQKGLWLENINNGELAFDADWRVRQGWRIYGEFLIDDMTSPTTLFDDHWKSKWATTIGTQLAFPAHKDIKTGVIIEWSRVEPWVYTHYVSNTSQALNQGVPVGNTTGPNSQSITCQLFGSYESITLSLRSDLVWKGSDQGSRGTDTMADNEIARKIFLKNADTPGFRMGPEFTWTRGWLSLLASGYIQWHGEVWSRTPVAQNEPVIRGRVGVQF